ncbi:hypothetical protein EBT31_19585 [bacterium]|nr:hypothetical protein [bacterium]
MTKSEGSGIAVVTADLSGHEPVACHTQDGLTICYYDVEGQAYLDFNWQNGSEWDVLANEETLRQVSCDLMQRLTGRAYVAADEWDVLLAGDESGEASAL